LPRREQPEYVEPANVLLVDDDAFMRQALRSSLRARGYVVEEASTGEEAMDLISQRPFDLVLLDLNMPGMGGLATCRQIRALRPGTGVLMLTVRDSEEDKVTALEAGADDYITKPFRLRELVARMQAVERRVHTEVMSTGDIARAGELEIDFQRRTVKKRGVEVRLSPTEFNLLAYLMRQPNVPVNHAKLLRAVWGPEYGGELEYLRTYIKMLRKKIEDDPANPQYIVTAPWLGYRFQDPSEPRPIEPTPEQPES